MVYDTIKTVLEAAGIKVYFLKPPQSPIAPYVYYQRVSSDKQGNFGYRIDRFRFTCVATSETSLKTLISSVESALFYNQTSFDLVEPPGFQMEGTEGSDFYSKIDMLISYKE